MRKSVAYLCLLFYGIAIILSGCSGHRQEGDSRKTDVISQIGKTATAEDIEDYSGDAEVVETIKQKDIEVNTALAGNVKFDKDTNASASLEYDIYSNKDQQLHITAADGVVWDLVIPAHALMENTTITMTSLKNVESSSLGALKAGVLLEPDGLEFYKPAKLTMSGSDTGENSILLNGNHDGSKIELAVVDKSEKGITASLLHFSTVYGDPLDNNKLSQLGQYASKEYDEIRKIALDYLKQPINAPTPPRISLRCPGDHKEQGREELRKFILLLDHPEGSLIRELTAAARTDCLLNDSNADKESIDISLSLLKRIVKKVDKLFLKYYPNEEYLTPICEAALMVERDYVMLGGEETHAAEAMLEWAHKVAYQFLDDLRKKHDYKAAKPARLLAKKVLLHNWNDNFLEEYKAALVFEVQFETELTIGGDGGNITYKTSGIDIYPFIVTIDDTEGDKEGVGEYVSFQSSEPELSLKMPNKFKFNSIVKDLDPCKNEPFFILIDRFGAKKENLIAGGISAPPTAGQVQACIQLLFNDIMTVRNEGEHTFYEFKVNLQNENVNAADAEFSKSMNGVNAKIKIRLVHTPK